MSSLVLTGDTSGQVTIAAPAVAGTTTLTLPATTGTVLNDATVGVCRAWVNFDGTLTGTITPRASFNVTSVTKNATGDYTITFTNALSDTNYSVVGMSRPTTGASNSGYGGIVSISFATAPTTSAVRVWTVLAINSSTASTIITAADSSIVNVSVFR